VTKCACHRDGVAPDSQPFEGITTRPGAIALGLKARIRFSVVGHFAQYASVAAIAYAE